MPTTAHPLLHRASPHLAIHPARAAVVPMLGTAPLFIHRMNEEEDRRRRHAQADPLHLGHLDSLLWLPHGQDIPTAALSAHEQACLRHLPRGALQRSPGHVRRLAVRPLVVDLVLTVHARPRRALEHATRFAPFCPRAVILERPARRWSTFLAEADFYGVGVFLAGEGEPERVLEPAPYRPARHTPASWAFCERLYRSLVEQ